MENGGNDVAKQKKTEPVAECQPDHQRVRTLAKAAHKGDEAAEKALQSELARIGNFIERACGGDETALAGIQRLLRQDPDFFVPALGGDLAIEAEQSLIRKATGTNLAFREALETKLGLLRKELASSSPNPVERLLVERVVACWLQLYYADVVAAQAENLTFQQGTYLQQKQDRAHRRFLTAIKTLATVRRLALPIKVDLNVAGKIETGGGKAPDRAPEPSPRWLPVSAN